MLDGLVAGLQVGREEGGRLAAVAEQQQLAALPGLIGLLALGGRERLVERGGDDGGGGVTASLELAHHGRAARAAAQAARDGVRLCVQPPYRPEQGPAASAIAQPVVPAAYRRPAASAKNAVIGVECPAGLLQSLVVLVHHDRRVPGEQPGPAFGGRCRGPKISPSDVCRTEPDRYTAPQRLQAPNSNIAAEQVPHVSRRASETCGPALDRQVYAPSLARVNKW